MKIRFARHTNRLEAIVDFYVNIIGLDRIGEFRNHSGYDGVFIGKSNDNWHLEFTQTTALASHTFDEDDLLVFYPDTQTEYDALITRLIKNGISIIDAKNPYWQENGVMVKDPDDHCVVISPLKIEKG